MDGSGAIDVGGIRAEADSSVVDGAASGFVSAVNRLDVSEGEGRPRPMPRATIASSRAWIRCFRTSLAAFLAEKRICRMASSIDFPAICLASGASFFIDVLKKCDRDKCWRSVRASCISFVRRPRRRICRITIRRCHLERAVGRGFSTSARCFGLRDSMESGSFLESLSGSALSSPISPSVSCSSLTANRLLSAKSPLFTAAALASSSWFLSLALTFAAAVPESGTTSFGVIAVGLGSGPFRCGSRLGVGGLVVEAPPAGRNCFTP